MDMETYQLARAAKMRAMSEAREKRKPALEADRQTAALARITSALTSTGGDVESAAELLGISRASAFRAVRKFAIDVKAIRKAAETSATPTGTPVAEN
jgi:transcriptional regulator of acetoin/glycerol metabolism